MQKMTNVDFLATNKRQRNTYIILNAILYCLIDIKQVSFKYLKGFDRICINIYVYLKFNCSLSLCK